MKKNLLFCCTILLAFAANAQNIAIPNYNQQKIDFYLGTASTPSNTLSSGLGNVNGVTFHNSNMFVAGGSSGILWYSGVNFNPYNLGSITPTVLSTGSATVQVFKDNSGNIYVANEDGTITEFIRDAFPPYYSSSNKVTVRFSNDVSAGLCIATINSIPTVWVNNLTSKTISVCRLSDFPAVGYVTTGIKAPFVKLLTGITNQNNEGIALDATGAVWVASNGSIGGYLNKIISSRVLTVVNSLNATSNANYALTASDIEEHGLTGGNKLGGLTYDAIYTNRMYCNDQPNDGSAQSVTRNVLAFVPSSMAIGGGAFSPPIVTSYLQTNPGNGQSAIIPCALLPTALASSPTINSGQTATLAASNCVAGATYQWKDGATIVGTNASYTTPALNATKIYTVACVNSASCTGVATNVTVTVNTSPYSISSCSGYSYMADVVFNKGTASSRGMQVYLANYTSGVASVTVAGTNITGSGSISAPNVHNFILPTINYDGGGNAGARNVTVTPANGTANCVASVIIEEPINFTFGDCSQEVLTGNFIFNVPSSGTLAIPITVQNNGPATFYISGLISGNLTTNLAVGQTSVTIPISYGGGQSLPFDVEWTTNITMARSYQATNHFCFGNAFSPNPVISANSSTVCEGQSISLSAAGCDGGGVSWYNGGSTASYTLIGTGLSISHIPTSTKNLYKATCSPFSNINPKTSGFSNIIQVNLNPKPVLTFTTTAPTSLQSYGNINTLVHIPPTQSADITATCNNGNILWENNSTNPVRNFVSPNPPISCSVNGYPSVYYATCTNSLSCVTTLNLAISGSVLINDQFSTPINTTISDNVTTNDINPFYYTFPGLNQISSTGTSITFQTTHGTITFTKRPMSSSLSGQFMYIPTTGFQGIDTFIYSTADGLDCHSNSATVTITIGNPCPTPLIIIPTVSNTGPVSAGQPVSLTSTNLAPRGQVANFNATNSQYIEVNQNVLGPNSTIEMWVKTNQANVGIFSTASNTSFDGNIYIGADGILNMDYQSNIIPFLFLENNKIINDNVWHHIALTCSPMDVNNLSFERFLYIDGQQAGYKMDNSFFISGQKFRIGVSYQNNTTTFFTGQIDNVRIWNKERSFSEIRQSAQLETPLNSTGLVYFAPLNGTTNATIGNNASNSSSSLPTFSNVNYYTYTWTGQNAPIASANEVQITTGAAGVSYNVNVTPALMCTSINATTAVTICTTPANPTAASANPATINEGETTTLSASGCDAGNSYRWKQGSLIVSSGTSFTSSALSTNTTYTVYCVNGTCESSGTDVVVTVVPVGFSISPTKYFAICQPTATVTATGCSGTVNWYRDTNGAGTTYQSLASGNTLTYTTDANWRQYIRATCTVGGTISPLSNYCTVQTGPEVDPISYLVTANTPISITASACPVGTTYLWGTGETTPSITKSPAIYTLYYVRCVSNTCQSADAVSYINVGNIIANNDTYTTNIYTPISGNFCTNDQAFSPKTVLIDYPPTHGSVVWDNTGAFTYTSNLSYSGQDSFTYYLTNGTGSFSNYATVTINIVCPTTLQLASTNSPSDDFSSGLINRQASYSGGTITATNKITGTANVIYQAKKVQLNPGFKADQGTVFKAQVGGCY